MSNDQYISIEKVMKYVNDRLVMLGYSPDPDEMYDLALIFIDFLVDQDMIEE